MKKMVVVLAVLLALLAILVWNNVVWDNAIYRKKERPAYGHNHELYLSREDDWYGMKEPQPTPPPTDEKHIIVIEQDDQIH